jgi:hypothetical protein
VVLLGWDPESEYRPSRWEPEDVLDFGDRFVVSTEQRGRGSGSGVAVTQPVFQVFTLRRELVLRQEDFLDRPKALEAANIDSGSVVVR